MSNKLTPSAARILNNAKKRASRETRNLNSTDVLLSSIKEQSSVASYVLTEIYNLDPQKIDLEIGKLNSEDAFTEKEFIEQISKEAVALKHNFWGTEHILLALVSRDNNLACQLLKNSGLDLKGVRNQVIELVTAEEISVRFDEQPRECLQEFLEFARKWIVTPPQKRLVWVSVTIADNAE